MHANSASPLGVGSSISFATASVAIVRPPGSRQEGDAEAGAAGRSAKAAKKMQMV